MGRAFMSGVRNMAMAGVNWLQWLAGAASPGTVRDLRWAWVTVGLSAAVAAGYVVIAVNRYFQAKVGRRADSKVSLARLRNILLCSVAFGYVFFATDMAWSLWRLYDVALLALAVYTWYGVVRMRGLGLVEERLARVEELERSADKYRQMAEMLPDVVWTATEDGHVDFCNQRWVEYVGARRAGEAGSWLEAVHPDEKRAADAWWAATLAGREPAARELRLRGVHGYRWFVVRAAPIVKGDAVRWLGACSDVEEQRRQLEAQEVQAKQKTFFLNALSHDLRAPLNIVALNAHLLKTSARDPADAESAKLIIENATAAGSLLTKALELARADAEDHNALEPVAVGELLQQVGRKFASAAEQKRLSLRVQVPVVDVEIVTDRQKLDRVVSNLVDNAIKFTQAGAVTVEVEAAGDSVNVRVSDTGPGVAEKNRPYLFEEFFQAEGKGPGRRGFGMGLTICRFLARQLGGDVRLAATGPGGSCFEATVRDMAVGAAADAEQVGTARHDVAV
jgi:PAS domain S-box-containing protein